MINQTAFLNSVSAIPINAAKTTNEESLEQAVGLNLLGDLNQQLGEIAGVMKSQMTQRQAIRGDIESVQTFLTRPTQTLPSGETGVAVTEVEKQALITLGFPKESLVPESGGRGYLAPTKALNSLIETKKEQISGLNSNSEITMIQVQSLMDQRKNALSLISNLMASKNESLMGIIRNLKS